MNKHLSIVIVTLMAGGGLCLAMNAQHPRGPMRSAPRATVLSSDSGVVCATGVVEPASRPVAVSAEVSGRVASVAATLGDVVSQDEPLLQIDPGDFELNRQVAAAELERARATYRDLASAPSPCDVRELEAQVNAASADLKQAERTLQRTQSLARTGAATPETLEIADTAVQLGRAQMAASQARLQRLREGASSDALVIAAEQVRMTEARYERARRNLNRTKLPSPSEGTVLEVNVGPGDLLDAARGQPLFVIADLSRLRVRAWVNEEDADRITLGMTAMVSSNGSNSNSYEGAVTELSPVVRGRGVDTGRPTEARHAWTREVWIELGPAAHALVVGMSVDVRFLCPDVPFCLP
jgi:multidrug resistance efflux pump